MPSRRISALTAPFSVHASASARMRIFSLVENLRRVAFAETSVAFDITFIIVDSWRALLTDLQRGSCLSHVGREGRTITTTSGPLGEPFSAHRYKDIEQRQSQAMLAHRARARARS